MRSGGRRSGAHFPWHLGYRRGIWLAAALAGQVMAALPGWAAWWSLFRRPKHLPPLLRTMLEGPHGPPVRDANVEAVRGRDKFTPLRIPSGIAIQLTFRTAFRHTEATAWRGDAPLQSRCAKKPRRGRRGSRLHRDRGFESGGETARLERAWDQAFLKNSSWWPLPLAVGMRGAP
jgi:hypothetical protein